MIGYLPEYRKLNPEWGNCLTDLVYFSIQPMPDGNLNVNALSIETLQSLQAMRATYGTRIHVSVGGFKRSINFAPMATNPVTRRKFIENLVAFYQKYGLDGVDFDWEFPESERETQAYAALLTEAKAAFEPFSGIVSVALYPSDELDLSPYASVDRIHIMSYDRGQKHATFEQAHQDAKLFLAAGAPKAKLVLGIPFYGRGMIPPYKAHIYSEIVKLYRPPLGIDEVDNIFFNGIITVQQKTCLVKAMDLRGVMIWELGQDSEDETSLLRAISRVLTIGCEKSN